MSNLKMLYKPVQGKTYSLFAEGGDSEPYYAEIKRLADAFLERCPDGKRLLSLIRKAGERSVLWGLQTTRAERQTIRLIKEALRQSLSVYTRNVSSHLRTLPPAKRRDRTLTTKEEKYHLYMLEIELVNRIYKEEFKRAECKFALIAHCLRDFRPGCRSEAGEIEAVCLRCTEDCLVHLGGILLEKYGIQPYISVEMEQEKLFRKLKQEHPSIGALGIACIPELAMGMRLCIRTGIPPVGIPLNANRCARWMAQAHETSFNLEQLEELLT
ncbi:MAG: DUF116 domain-containing protein [Deltaproteobacteria bacterium]|nr:DUF116 domain-containing protein [Deltaproteobacteria bacterium]